MPLLHLFVSNLQFSFAGLMRRDLGRTGTAQTVLGEMLFNLPATRTRCFQILFAIALDFRLIEEHLAEHGLRGAGAAQIAAHQTREGKLEITHEEMQHRHREMAETFGNQVERVIKAANERAHYVEHDHHARAQSAISFSQERNFEREAVADERALM